MTQNVQESMYGHRNEIKLVKKCRLYNDDKCETGSELSTSKASIGWNNDGYCIDTHYYDLDEPLEVTKYQSWLAEHYV